MKVAEKSDRNWVLGVDVVYEKGTDEEWNPGQFAVLLRAHRKPVIVWKGYPLSTEQNWIAGYGRDPGQEAKRVQKTALGKTILLVCHDVAAFTNRGKANTTSQDRKKARKSLARSLSQNPTWALNLVHSIKTDGNARGFHNKYAELSKHNGTVEIAGAFGYDGQPSEEVLRNWASLMRVPNDSGECVVLL